MDIARSVATHSSRNITRPSESLVRRQIVAVARKNYFSRGFRSVTMDDLATELGISKRTLYVYFPGKSSLMEAVLLEELSNIEADLENLAAKWSLRCSSDFFQAMADLLSCLQHHAEEIHTPFLRDMRQQSLGALNLVNVEKRRRNIFRRYFGRLFSKGRDIGILRKDIPPELITELMLAVGQTVRESLDIEKLGLTMKTASSAIITMFLEGIIARKKGMIGTELKTTKKISTNS